MTDTENTENTDNTNTGDENKPKRPNAKYKLSKPDKVDAYDEQNLVFYYNRERRLAKAPQIVRDLYTKKKQSRFGRFNLFAPLVADKPRAMLFFTIVILYAFIYVLSLMGYFDSSYSLDGNKIEIEGAKYENMAIVTVKKTTGKNESSAYTGAVDIAVSPVVTDGEDFPVFYHRVFFSLDGVEEYRFVVPFDSPELLIVLQTEKSKINAKFKPE